MLKKAKSVFLQFRALFLYMYSVEILLCTSVFREQAMEEGGATANRGSSRVEGVVLKTELCGKGDLV